MYFSYNIGSGRKKQLKNDYESMNDAGLALQLKTTQEKLVDIEDK
jgi:phage gp16-like protein